MRSRIIVIRIFIALLIIIAFILLILPYAARKIVENRSEDLIGRKMVISDLDLNILTVTLSIDDFVLYEENGTDPFVSFNTLKINMQPWRLLKKEYAISEFFLDGLTINVYHDGNKFNFDSMIPVKDTTSIKESKTKKEVHFSFENIHIENGSYKFVDKSVGSTFSGKDLEIRLPLLAWDNQKSDLGFNLNFGRQGSMSIDADFNQITKEYWITTEIDSMQIHPLAEYLGAYINTTDVHGTFYNTLKVHGSLGVKGNIVVSGNAKIKDFVLNDHKGDSISNLQELYIRLDSVDILNQYYQVGAIKITEPFIHYEKYDSIHSNITELLSPMSADSAEIAPTDSLEVVQSDSIEVTAIDTLSSHEEKGVPLRYIVDSVLLVDGKVSFIDKSLDRNFYYNLDEINIAVYDIDSEADRIQADINMRLQKEGELKITSGFSIKNPMSIDAVIDLRKLDMVSLTPYSEYFIARPIHQGRMIYLGDVEMTRDTLIVKNDFWLRELEFGERVNSEKRVKAPIRLALNILKDKNDNIEMHVPVNGNPSDPDFEAGKMIWGTFSGFFGKIAAKPKKIRPHLFGKNPNKIEKIKLELAQQDLTDKNKKILEQIDKIFEKEDRKQSRKKKETEHLYFVLTQEPLLDLEKKELAVQYVCREYLLKELKPATHADSLEMITKLLEERNANSGLIKYMNQLPVTPENLGFEDKCVAIVGEDKLRNQMYALIAKRNKIVEKYLLEDLGIDKSRIEVRTTDLLNFTPEFDVPIFRIESAVLMEHVRKN